MNRIVHPRSLSSGRPAVTVFLIGLIAVSAVPAATATTGWLGVSVQDVTPELREALELSVQSGALVSDVAADSPADQAGVESGDVILRVDEVPVEDADDLIAAIRDRDPGDRVDLTLSRGDEQMQLRATLGERADDETEFRWFGRSIPRFVDPLRRLTERRVGPRLGVEVTAINRDLGSYFNAKPGHGLLVLSVVSGSVAEDAGIRAGDVLLRFNGELLTEPEDLREAVGELEAGDRWELRTLRKGREIEMRGEIDAADLQSERWQGFFQRRERDRDRQDEGTIDPQIRRLERQVERLEERLRKLESQMRRLDRR